VLSGLRLRCEFGGRDGIRTHDLLIANEEKSEIRCDITITQIFEAPSELDNSDNRVLLAFFFIFSEMWAAQSR